MPMPSIKFKNHTHTETIQAKKEMPGAFYSPFNIIKALPLFVRTGIRERCSEETPKSRLKKFKKKGGAK